MVQLKQFIEQKGIYIFFISLTLFTQINWIRRYMHRNIELRIEARLLASFIVGILISLGIIKLIKKIAVKANKDPKILLSNLSIALSPGIFFVFASKNKIFLIIGAALCTLIGLYIWAKPFRNFVKTLIYQADFDNILTVKDGKAVIKIQGMYTEAEPQTLQSFLIDLVINLHECSEMKIEEIKVDFSSLKGKDENELKKIMEPIARCFNIRIV